LNLLEEHRHEELERHEDGEAVRGERLFLHGRHGERRDCLQKAGFEGRG